MPEIMDMSTFKSLCKLGRIKKSSKHIEKIEFPLPSTPGLRSNLRKLTGSSNKFERNFQKAMKVKNKLKKVGTLSESEQKS